MKVTQIEKLNQLISRTDMTGNQKVDWLTNFINGHVVEQLRVHDVVEQSEQLVCPNCKSKHIGTSTHKGFLQGYCFVCSNHWANKLKIDSNNCVIVHSSADCIIRKELIKHLESNDIEASENRVRVIIDFIKSKNWIKENL